MSLSLVDDLGFPAESNNSSPPLAANVIHTTSIAQIVQAAILEVLPSRETVERRRERRHLFPYPIHITPIAADSRIQIESAFYVLGKHLSQGGMDFYYAEPVPYRRVVATLPPTPGEPIALLLDLTWCRFGAHRWYENGGKFVQAVFSPLHRPDAVIMRELEIPAAGRGSG